MTIQQAMEKQYAESKQRTHRLKELEPFPYYRSPYEPLSTAQDRRAKLDM
jgi:hypothetical protein